MSDLWKPLSIAGLVGRVPIGCCVTAGRKGPNLNPVETDRFYIKSTMCDLDRSRPLHADFTAYNTAEPELRRTIRGNLVHVTEQEAFEHYLRAFKLPGVPATPHDQPACCGDGKTARRWTGNEFRIIRCPNELCEFRMRSGAAIPCVPFARMLFQLRWPTAGRFAGLPAILCKLTTKSWNSVAAFLGFFESFRMQCSQLGCEPNLFGLPIILSLAQKTRKPDAVMPKGSRFPVMTLSVDGSLPQFLLKQHEFVSKLRLTTSIPDVARLTDEEQQSPATIAVDVAEITPQPQYRPRRTDPAATETAEPVREIPAAASCGQSSGSGSGEDLFDGMDLEPPDEIPEN